MTRPVTVSDEVLRRVREHVQKSFAAGEKLPSQRELAELYGVSQATVHRALTRLAEEGEVEARSRVRWCRSESTRNISRKPRSRRALRVGLITRRTVNEFNNSRVSEPYRSLYEEAERRGVEVVTYNNPRLSHPIPRRNRIDWPLVPWSSFDVGILIEVEFPDSLGDPALRRHRVLAMDQDARFFGLHSVSCDDRGAGREAARILWQHGHRRFALTDQVSGKGFTAEPTWLARCQGFEEAVLRLGGAIQPDWRVLAGRHVKPPEQQERAERIAKRWASAPKAKRPTALLATDTSVLSPLLSALAERSIRMPEDLSVIAFAWRQKKGRERRKAGPLPGGPTRRRRHDIEGYTSIAIDPEAMARRALDVAQQWLEQGKDFFRGIGPQLFTAPFGLQHGETVRRAKGG